METSREKAASRREKEQRVVDVATAMRRVNHTVWRSSQIREAVLKDYGLKITDKLVVDVLKSKFNMRYRKVKRVPYAGNTNRSLNLRFRCAKVLLNCLSEGKRLISIDETWLAECDMRQMCWRKRGEPGSAASRPISTRLTVITAIDTDGNCYSSLSHVNTNAETFKLFLWKLISTL